MKKTLTTLVAVFAIFQFSYAQWTTSGNNIYNSNTGSVGIGTTAPPTIGNYGVLAINGKTSSQGGCLSLMTNGTELGAIVANSQFNIQAGSGITTQFYTGSSSTIQISGSGNVGIGTINPGQKLDVVGNIRIATGNLLYFDSANGSNIFQHSTGSFSINAATSGGGNGNLILNAATGAGLYLNFSSGANTFFGNGASGTTGVIQSNGNMGIGTTSPDQKLTVKGKIHSEEVIVDLSVPGPDYVFEPEYKLPDLIVLKAYLDKNHHLPEVPSAKEMAENGISLSEMNVTLLKKVEELTLYLINQDTQLAEQQKINKSLQNQINKLTEKMK